MKPNRPLYAIEENSDSDNGNDVELWCICRSTDGSRFMIACDNCEDWFHGDCVNITPGDAEYILKYFCPICTKKNPSLKIAFKPSYNKLIKKDKPQIKKEKVDEFKSNFKPAKIEEKIHRSYKLDNEPKNSKSGCGECINCHRKVDCQTCVNCRQKLGRCLSRVCVKKLNKHQVEKPLPPPPPPVIKQPVMLSKLPTEFIPQKPTNPPKKVPKPINVLPPTPKLSQNTSKPRSISSENSDPPKKRKRPLGDSSDDLSDDSTHNNIPFRQNPIKKHNFDLNATKQVKQIPSKPINKVVKPASPLSSTSSEGKLCSNRKELSYQLYNESDNSNVDDEEFSTTGSGSEEDNDTINNETTTTTSTNDLNCNKIKNQKEFSSESSDEPIDVEDEEFDQSKHLVSTKKSRLIKKPMKKAINKKPIIKPKKVKPRKQSKSNNEPDDQSISSFNKRPSRNDLLSARSTRNRNVIEEDEDVNIYKSPTCFNIDCTKPARDGSKYCSDKCGIELATMRIQKFLPSRIRNWNERKPIATIQAEQAIQDTHAQLENIIHNISILEKSYEDQVKITRENRIKFLPTNSAYNNCGPNNINNDEDSNSAFPTFNSITNNEECSIECVTCGQMINTGKAIQHMENCFQKVESATMVFADQEEYVFCGRKLFCDYRDNNVQGFCKRLAALCDHNKDPKDDPETICAFPYEAGKPRSFCHTTKLKCNKHINWERISRAVIDMRKYRLLMRLEELQTELHKLNTGNLLRGGVMDLLLNETIDHQPMKPIVPPKQERFTKSDKKTEPVWI